MGWSYSFWKGSFYPKDVTAKDFLAFYARRLNSVEVDSTFYRIPRVETVEEWRSQTPEDFVFSLKFPQVITHVKMLKDCQVETKVFLDRVSLLGEKLGVLLLQFSPMFRQQHLPLLRDYLKTLPESHRYAVEVRNKSLLNDEVYALLRERRVALVWVDASKMPLMSEVTADFVYVRWEGDRKTVTGTLGNVEIDRKESLRAWAGKLKPLLDGGMEVFGYFSKYYSGFPTGDAGEILESLAEAE
jgi:uncharacterized protein YecE (DUF72 family)